MHRPADPLARAADVDGGPVRDAIQADGLDRERPGRGGEAQVERPSGAMPSGDGGAQGTRGERGQERVAGPGRVHLSAAGRQVSDRPAPVRASPTRTSSPRRSRASRAGPRRA